MNHLLNFAREFGYTPDDVKNKWCSNNEWSKTNPTLEQYYPMIYVGNMVCDKLFIERNNFETWLCQKIDMIFGVLVCDNIVLLNREYISFSNTEQFNEWIDNNIEYVSKKVLALSHTGKTFKKIMKPYYNSSPTIPNNQL
jgi:hypothetical protein